LGRDAPSLSVGEAQRIRLATQIGSKLTGVLYVLDEPSIGLHARDQERLIKALENLRDIGNTVLVVEHDEQTIKKGDWIIDIGPGAGRDGGKIIFEGTPQQLLKAKTPTGEYLSGQKKIELFKKSNLPRGKAGKQQTTNNEQFIIIKGAKEYNLKNIDVKIPLGVFICITGVSGSGKSTLMNDILARALSKKFHQTRTKPGEHKKIIGLENLNKVVIVDQSPIGRTPRSNPATYTGIFTHIRDLFTKTKQAKVRGYKAGYFSFNIKGGRCEECQGAGLKKIEMYYLPD
jgi:excinuclease ABC subunit A